MRAFAVWAATTLGCLGLQACSSSDEAASREPLPGPAETAPLVTESSQPFSALRAFPGPASRATPITPRPVDVCADLVVPEGAVVDLGSGDSWSSFDELPGCDITLASGDVIWLWIFWIDKQGGLTANPNSTAELTHLAEALASGQGTWCQKSVVGSFPAVVCASENDHRVYVRVGDRAVLAFAESFGASGGGANVLFVVERSMARLVTSLESLS